MESPFIKKLIKFILVVLQPLMAVWLIYIAFIDYDWLPALCAAPVMLLSSAVHLALLDSIKILPSIKITKKSQVGLSLGLSSNGSLAILIPFFYIELSYKKKDTSTKL